MKTIEAMKQMAHNAAARRPFLLTVDTSPYPPLRFVAPTCQEMVAAAFVRFQAPNSC
jgi:hypothetical protein